MTSVAQVGTDRIIEIQFSEGQYHLFLEFYAGGNIVLTNADLSILTLLRTVPEGPDQEELRVGLKYSLENRQNVQGIPSLTRQRVKDGLQRAIERTDEESSTHRKKLKRKPGDGLRKAIATSLTEFPPLLIDHALKVSGFDTTILPEAVVESDSILDNLMLALNEAQRVFEELHIPGQYKGYIIAKPAKSSSILAHEENNPYEAIRQGNLVYDDFHPFRPKQFVESTDIAVLEFDGFNQTVDEFFSSVESQKLESRLTEREENAKRKLENAKLDYDERIGGLKQIQELNVRKAQALEANLQRVQEAIGAVNSLLAQGMDWQNVARLIEVEKERHNVVAEMIKLPLKLYENTITLLVVEEDFEDEADFEGNETGSEVSDSEIEKEGPVKPSTKHIAEDKRLAVDVDLALSPWSNARQYYDQRKSAAVKEQKTIQSSEKALKSTEKKIGADLQKGLKQEKDLMRPQRKAYWFEKFIYFISSENYLVLGGKDAQQNEILYQRYLKRGDAYVHADIQGAASIIVKNKPGKADDPLPPSTLSQAGTLAVATSTAWDSKAVMSAWWVQAEQVSKTTPSGDFLQPGIFGINGAKNFLPPAQLLLGFGLLFKISEGSKARHLKHRVHDEASAEGASKNASVHEEALDQQENLDDDDKSVAGSSIDDSDDSHEIEADIIEEPRMDGADVKEEEDDDHRSTIDLENPLQPGGHRKSTATMISDQEFEEKDLSEPIEALGKPSPGAGAANASSCEAIDLAPQVGSAVETVAGEKFAGLNKISDNESPSLHATSTTDMTSADPSRSVTPASSVPFTSKAPSNKPKTQQGQSQVRGKRGKRQKQKTKYANQDSEDRALAMRLLGSAAAQEKAKEDAAAKVAKEQELAEQKERRRKQHALVAERGRRAEEERRKKFEAEGGVDEEAQNAETSLLEELDAFVGAPLPGDDILDGLVVCGPWDAMGARCRWRVKLQPGSVKKGKAVKEILGRWNQVVGEGEKRKRLGGGEGNDVMAAEEKVRKREGELIRAIRDVEVVGVVPVGKVRVVIGGGDKTLGGNGGRGGSGAGRGKRGGKGGKRK